MPFESTETTVLTRVFSDSGMVLIEGTEDFVGRRDVVQIGATTFESRTQSIIQSDNGILIENEVRAEWDCGNSCQYAFDGVCDEVTFCELGADCFDCGPVVTTGIATTSYQVVNENTIRRVATIIVSEEDDNISTESWSCEAILTR